MIDAPMPDTPMPDTPVTVVVVIPALNEEASIGTVVEQVLGQPNVAAVVVANNGSTDQTAAVSRTAGAVVVNEDRPGYGYACATGSNQAMELGATVIVYIDGDGSSPPSELADILSPILDGDADLVLGRRQAEPGAMPTHQKFGNWLSARLMRLLYQIEVDDLGPFRAIRVTIFERLQMSEMTFGWPTEMTVKAARLGCRVTEVPTSWLHRTAGRSKVGGTLKGSILAGYYILGVTLKNIRWQERSN